MARIQVTGQALGFQGKFLKITASQDEAFRDAFHWLDITAQYKIADSWCLANSNRRPRNHNRFMHNWLMKAPKPPDVSERLRGQCDEGWWLRTIDAMIHREEHLDRDYQKFLKDHWDQIPEKGKQMLREAMGK